MTFIKRQCTDCGKEFSTHYEWKTICFDCLRKKWLSPKENSETIAKTDNDPKIVYVSTSRGCGKSEFMRQMLEKYLEKGTDVSFKLYKDFPFVLTENEETPRVYCHHTKIDTDNMDALCYSLKDIEIVKEAFNKMYGIGIEPKLRIKKLIFDYPATIVYWYDNTKTVVKCREGETFDLETGLAMAICKKQMGDNYKSRFRKLIKNAVIKNKAPKVSKTDKLNEALNDVLDDMDGMLPLQDVMDQIGSGAVNVNDKYPDGGF